MLKECAECVNLGTLALKGDISMRFSGQIFHPPTSLGHFVGVCAEGGEVVFMAVSCRRMADQGWRVTAEGGARSDSW